MGQDFRLLLVAQSARMLAESAVRAGLRCVAIDLFGDEDTRIAAERCLTVPGGACGMDAERLLAAAEQLAPADGRSAFAYGSGVDTRPEIVENLSDGRICLGNAPSTLRLLHHPPAFFELLTRLGIPYPETRMTAPGSPEGWLIKRGCGEGGRGVRYCAGNHATGGDYYQRHVEGEALSVLFLADRQAARILGYNTMQTSSHDPGQPFSFAGAVNRANLSDGQRESIAEYASRLTRAAGLIGLNGLDFMLEDGVIRVLEVNPRPTASLQLFDADHWGGLLRAHIEACLHKAPESEYSPGPVRAFRIVHASATTLIAEGVQWPEGCSDRPMPGMQIGPGEPLCTVSCEAATRQQAEAILDARESDIRRLLHSPGH